MRHGRSPTSRGLRALLLLALAGLPAGVAHAQTAPRLTADETISPTGEVRSRFVLTYSASDYASLKERVPDPQDIARLGVEADVDAVMVDAMGSYDDQN